MIRARPLGEIAVRPRPPASDGPKRLGAQLPIPDPDDPLVLCCTNCGLPDCDDRDPRCQFFDADAVCRN